MGVSMDKQAQVSALGPDRHGVLWCLITDQTRPRPTGSSGRLLAKSAMHCNRLSADHSRAANLVGPATTCSPRRTWPIVADPPQCGSCADELGYCGRGAARELD